MSGEAILNESRKEEKKSNNKTSNDVCVLTQPMAIWLSAFSILSQAKIQYVVWLLSF